MRRLQCALLATVAAIGFASVASAADMPVKAPMMMAPAAYNWSGFYIGANIGASWADPSNSLSIANGTPGYFFPAAIAGVNANGTFSNTQASFTGGGQIGYNVQTGNIVWGAEADINWLNNKASNGGTFLYTTNSAPYNLSTSMSADWLMTARGRLGYAMDRSLFYLTGGVALTQLKFAQTFSESGCATCVMSYSSSATRAGWTIGGGYEYAMNNNWSVKAEYLFAQFSNTNFVGSLNALGGNATFNNSVHLNVNVARVGLNYKFN
jgi:outer membrane immunogenic protein